MSEAVASLSLDLDNQWSYLKTHGDKAWRDFPSYLDMVVPHIFELCDRLELDITVFVVGQDAALDENAAAMSALGSSRHEIGNHSFHHEPWLHLHSPAQIAEEIRMAGDAIRSATGRSPDGFRGPGFSLSRATLDVLANSGYRYDASTLPTFIGPLARAYYLRRSGLDREDRRRRDRLFGAFSEGFRPLKPYCWELEAGSELIEIPVTTMPLLRLPIHVTYLHYLARVSEAVARTYLATALSLCRLTGVQPSMLLHSLDFLGGDDIGDLSFFPGMDMPGERKRRLVAELVGRLAERHRLVTLGEHATLVGRTVMRSVASSSLA
jgi:peptidoglycan/xylan/chitin deacetylase (PgdA/CDA1 family)